MPLEVLAERLKKFLVFVLLFLLAACAAFCLLAARQGHFSSVPAFRAYVLRFGALGPVVLAAVQAIQVILPVLPGFLGCAAGAGLFGAAGLQLHWHQPWFADRILAGTALRPAAGAADGAAAKIPAGDRLGVPAQKLYAGFVSGHFAAAGTR